MTLVSCTQNVETAPEPVDIGLLMPITGPYASPGADMKDAFELYVDANGGKLGGREINFSLADEGADPKKAAAKAKDLIEKDDVKAIIGVGSGQAYALTAPLAAKHEVPLVGAGGQVLPEGADMEYLWLTSFLAHEAGQASAKYIKEQVDGPVYTIGPDYPGGYLELAGFTKTFEKIGGELANPSGKTEWTPWPATKDFGKYFDQIAETDAKAIYAFYAGKPAVQFVKAYAKSKAKDIPLYGAFLTEGPVLAAQGKDALGVYTAMNYSPDIDNAANRTLTSTWSASHPDRQTNVYTVTGWDCARILDQAIGSIDKDEEVTSQAINKAIADLGTINSPRGSWQFSEKTHSPVQRWYMRKVDYDGPVLTNVVVKDLATVGG